MKTRVITGACFAAIIVGFLSLRQCVDYRLFSILIWFISFVGAFEMARAVKPFTSKANFVWTVVCGFALVPVFCAVEYRLLPDFGGFFALGVILLAVIGNIIIGIIKKLKSRGIIYSIISSVYPSVLFTSMLMVNEMGKSSGFVILVMAFTVSCLTDTFAYLIGSWLKGPKLCPKLSPKKTVSGAIGGVIGGIIGAILVYYLIAVKIAGSSAWYVYVVIGVIASVFTQLGDLFESAIKRSVNIKDMGKIMPGHGGILDRFDGIMFSVLVIGLAFGII